MTTTWSPTSEYDGLSAETQKARVRELIRSAGPDGLCSILLYRVGIPNGRTRVYALRDDDGLDIETVRCDLAKYHAGERCPGHVRFIGWWWRPHLRQLRLLRI